MNRATGIDISYAQGAYARQTWHDFVIARAAYGTLEDSWFGRHMEQVEGVPVVGAYQYMRSPNVVSWRAQADALARITEPHLDRIHFLAIDFEKFYNKPSMAFARGAFALIDWIAAWSGRRTLLYSSPSVVQEWMFHYGVYDARTWGDLWVAQWPFRGWDPVLETVPVDEDWQPRLPAGCSKWQIWQYSADGNRKGMVNGVKSHDVDLDVYNGTLQEMRAWLGLEPQEPRLVQCADCGHVHRCG